MSKISHEAVADEPHDASHAAPEETTDLEEEGAPTGQDQGSWLSRHSLLIIGLIAGATLVALICSEMTCGG